MLDAALELFAEKGYFGTSLRDIARAVGVRESALYNYFPSKELLFEAVIFADREETAARLAPFLDAPAPDLRPFLEELAFRIIEGFTATAQRQRFRILMSDGIRLALEGRINLIDQQVASKSQAVRTIITRLIDEGRLRGADAEFLTFQFIAPLMTWRQLQALRPDFPLVTNPRAFARAHVEQFLSGSELPAVGVPAVRRRGDNARARTK